ncbi:MAG: hypothetical protein AB1498_00605 [bacterium]
MYLAAFRNPEGPSAMFKPYINVIRMHFMIFIIGILGMLGLKSFIIYITLFLYFFPLSHFITEFKNKPLD